MKKIMKRSSLVITRTFGNRHTFGPPLYVKCPLFGYVCYRDVHYSDSFCDCFSGHYLGHLIGHEGKGSLLSELKNLRWVNSLVGGQKGGAKGFEFFVVNLDLTEEGLEHVDEIIHLV